MVASDYPFLDVFWSMMIFFLWVAWIWILIMILSDLFRRHDLSGWGKALWVIFVIIAPFLGVLVYLIFESKGIAERNMQRQQQYQAQADDYIRTVASTGDPAEQIAKAKQLLDSGAITAEEFAALKQKALAT
jgi:Short C-terminal domain/Phospholipase_D-nuclease N-terminal